MARVKRIMLSLAIWAGAIVLWATPATLSNASSLPVRPQAAPSSGVPPTVGGVVIAKRPDLQQVEPGATVTVTIEVTNTGILTLTGVTVTDPLAPACDAVLGELAPGVSRTL